MTLPAFAAASAGAQQQTRRTPPLLLIDGTDRRTDGRTLDRYIDPQVLQQCSDTVGYAAGRASGL